MNIREAVPGDNHELQELQAKCPQGTTIVTSTVNTPDFFARARAYELHKVFVACEGDRIIGSAACALRDAVVIGSVHQPDARVQFRKLAPFRGSRGDAGLFGLLELGSGHAGYRGGSQSKLSQVRRRIHHTSEELHAMVDRSELSNMEALHGQLAALILEEQYLEGLRTWPWPKGTALRLIGLTES